MAKQPYIPLYIGDWERDLNCVSLEAEGAAIKLVFKLWNSPTRGLLSICFSQMAILFKKSEPEARKIFAELHRNNIFDVKENGADEVEISSRRMLRESSLSRVRSESGKQGGRPKSKSEKQTKSKKKAKQKQIPDNDTDIEDDNDTEFDSFEKSEKLFEPPTISMCEEFFTGCQRDAEEGRKFFFKYQQRGWKDGTGADVTDWLALAQSWILNGKKTNGHAVNDDEYKKEIMDYFRKNFRQYRPQEYAKFDREHSEGVPEQELRAKRDRIITDVVEEFWEHYKTRGWVVPGGVAIVDRLSAFKVWMKKEKQFAK